MSKAEVIAELMLLSPEDRDEVFDVLCDLRDQAAVGEPGPSEEVKRLLDEAMEEYEKNPSSARPFDEVIAELRAERE